MKHGSTRNNDYVRVPVTVPHHFPFCALHLGTLTLDKNRLSDLFTGKHHLDPSPRVHSEWLAQGAEKCPRLSTPSFTYAPRFNPEPGFWLEPRIAILGRFGSGASKSCTTRKWEKRWKHRQTRYNCDLSMSLQNERVVRRHHIYEGTILISYSIPTTSWCTTSKTKSQTSLKINLHPSHRKSHTTETSRSGAVTATP